MDIRTCFFQDKKREVFIKQKTCKYSLEVKISINLCRSQNWSYNQRIGDRLHQRTSTSELPR